VENVAGPTGSTEKACGRDRTGSCSKEAAKLQLTVDASTQAYPVFLSISSYFHLQSVPKPCYNGFAMKMHGTGTDSVPD